MDAQHNTTRYGGLRPLLTINEAAAFLSIERSTLYRLLRQGEIRSARIGDRHRFRPEDLERYVESRCEPAASP